MAGIRMTWEEIRRLVINPQTGRPITKTTLSRAFKAELADGKAKLKSIVATRFYEALHRGEPWAVQMGLKTQFGWKPDGQGGLISPPEAAVSDNTVRVEFVLPAACLEGDEASPPPPQRLLPLQRKDFDAIDVSADVPSSRGPFVPRKRAGSDWMA